MDYSQLFGFLGTTSAILAYFPQIIHLVKEHCSAGISRYAYTLWFAASALLLAHALLIDDKVFIALMGFNTAANAFIIFYAGRYKGSFCKSHMPANASHS